MIKTVVEIEDNLINSLYQKSIGDGGAAINKCVNEAHSQLIIDLIYTYLRKRKIKDPKKIVSEYFICNDISPQYRPSFDISQIPSLCEQLQIIYLNSGFKVKKDVVQRIISKENMISSGAVYTQNHIVEDIVSNTLKYVDKYESSRFLDFACGTGRFYQSLVNHLISSNIQPKQVVTKCVAASDINLDAINITRLKACTFIEDLSKDVISQISKQIVCENALMIKKEADLFTEIEPPILYDAIVSNPPYLVLKPSHKTSPELAEDMKRQVAFYRNSGLYHYSIEGMLNLYQLSIERMINLLKPSGELGVICPSTLFADKSASKLRKHMLCKNKVRHITYYPENAVLFENNVTQATNIFFMQKGGTTDTISITAGGKDFLLSFGLIKELFEQNMEIPLISDIDWQILKKLTTFPKLKTIAKIRNKRGELDLTLNGHYIVSKPTSHHLIRGKMITPKGIDRTEPEYVCEQFVNSKSEEYRNYDYGRVRLVGQNICNIDNPQRLNFTFCEPSDILGNSCNYLSSDISTLKKLHILLSSALLNWRFKITSTNNHINNYELDDLPIADLEKMDETRVFNSTDELNHYVCSLYKLNKKETEYICKL